MPHVQTRLADALSRSYRLERELGQGGMATVYLAVDLRHHRQVAIKVLRAEFAAALGAERFLREIETTANLRHPHILPLYDSGEANGFLFYVMPYIEGESLRNRLEREKQLPVEEALQIGREVADALNYAHGRGVIHRDIKPENILLESGHAVVADFGIARAVRAAGTEKLTQAGMWVGSPTYMSPEQASGQIDLDGRSDLYSLGCVLFEMIAGAPPFTGPSPQAVIAKRFMEAPPSVTSLRDAVPSGVSRAVARLLQREPTDRFATGAELVGALRGYERRAPAEPGAPQTASGRSAAAREQYSPSSIAVLPFTDMSAARDQDWFCEGIAEEILNALTRLPGLKVATRTSAFRFKDAARDLGKIGAALGVTTLLEGSVRTAGSKLRVTAQLSNAGDGSLLWSERFDGQLEDVFEIQEQIAEQTVKALQLRMETSDTTPVQSRHSEDLEAYQLFLKGRHFRYSKLDLKSALRCFELAVGRDPTYALARVAMAETLTILGSVYGVLPPSLGQARAKEELRKARELGGESGQAAHVEGLLALLYDWDTRASLRAFERALALEPSSVPSQAWYSVALVVLGRREDAVQQVRLLIEHDPQSPWANAMAGGTCLQLDRVEDAVVHLRRALELDPGSLHASWLLGMALAARSNWREAQEWLHRAVTVSARAPHFVGLLAWCQAASGQQAEARQALAELEHRSASEYVSPLFLAWAFSELDEPEKTRRLLQEAFTERAGILAIMQFPFFRRLRGEPLMVELRRQLLGQ